MRVLEVIAYILDEWRREIATKLGEAWNFVRDTLDSMICMWRKFRKLIKACIYEWKASLPFNTSGPYTGNIMVNQTVIRTPEPPSYGTHGRSDVRGSHEDSITISQETNAGHQGNIGSAMCGLLSCTAEKRMKLTVFLRHMQRFLDVLSVPAEEFEDAIERDDAVRAQAVSLVLESHFSNWQLLLDDCS